MSKLKIFEEMKSEVLSCTKCDLGCDTPDGEDPHVMGEGNLDADIMFIAEAPGKEETIHDQPLTPTGTAGRTFETVLKRLDLKREDVYVTNTVLCRPEGNADPMPYQVLKCEEYFRRQLDIVKPRLVVTFGRFAAEAMLGYVKITKDRGQIKHSEKFDVDVFPLYHPAYVAAYASSERRQEFWKKDLKKLRWLVREFKNEDLSDTVDALSA